MNPDDELEDPHGYIEVDGELMGFWLPEGVRAEDIGVGSYAD
jgi:hypothetical protein